MQYFLLIIYLKKSHSLCTGVTVQYFLHIARVKESRSLELLMFLEEKILAAILSSTAIEK